MRSTRPRLAISGRLRDMRVLMWVGAAYTGIPGGHRVQADRTAEALRLLDVEVELGQDAKLATGGFDLVHVMDGDAAAIRRIRRARLPVVMSTIYWSKSYRIGPGPNTGAVARLVFAARIGVSSWRRGAAATAEKITASLTEQRLVFESADLLLPNSISEGEAVVAELGVTTPFHVVPNGVDHRTFVPPSGPGGREGVLYVARIEPHKNQLGLIRALKGTGLPLTLVGPVHPHHAEYERACREASGPEVTVAGVRSLAELIAHYQRTRVHAIPSWFETTGLSSLEAASCGAAVVTTSRGYARDYFGDLVHYCDPADPTSVRAAVEAAMSSPPSPVLRERVLENFTWDHAAAATLDAYRRTLNPGVTSMG